MSNFYLVFYYIRNKSYVYYVSYYSNITVLYNILYKQLYIIVIYKRSCIIFSINSFIVHLTQKVLHFALYYIKYKEYYIIFSINSVVLYLVKANKVT